MTFENNEYLIVDQLTYHLDSPERGDVVILGREPERPIATDFCALGEAKRKERREGDVPESERSVAQAFAVERTLDGAVYAGDETDENRRADESEIEKGGAEDDGEDGGRERAAEERGFRPGVPPRVRDSRRGGAFKAGRPVPGVLRGEGREDAAGRAHEPRDRAIGGEEWKDEVYD